MQSPVGKAAFRLVSAASAVAASVILFLTVAGLFAFEDYIRVGWHGANSHTDVELGRFVIRLSRSTGWSSSDFLERSDVSDVDRGSSEDSILGVTWSRGHRTFTSSSGLVTVRYSMISTTPWTILIATAILPIYTLYRRCRRQSELRRGFPVLGHGVGGPPRGSRITPRPMGGPPPPYRKRE